MTEVQFHFNVADRLGYACRLLRKAYRLGTRVAVTGPLATLTRLDRALWTFDVQEFLPHVLVRASEPLAPRLRDTPICLVERAELATQHPVLVHLGEEPAEGFESFARLIEIVSADPAERETARVRWKYYAGRGYEIAKFGSTASTGMS